MFFSTKRVIDRLLLGHDLPARDSERAFHQLFRNTAARKQDGKTILTLLQKKGEHPDELVGLVRTIRKLEPKFSLPQIPDLVDGCGTGGDGTRTFNISTIASLIAAGAGAHVAKHGNRSISSRCGSADLLEALGVNIQAPVRRMIKAIRVCGFGYFHAPKYHPLFRRMQPIRQELGRIKIKTIFNLVGPLVNPLRPKCQAVGVYRRDFVRVLAHAMRQLNYRRALIFASFDGLDELTTSSRSFLIELNHGKLLYKILDPARFRLKPLSKAKMRGGNARENQQIATRLLDGRDIGGRCAVVILNAAAMLYVSGRVKNLQDGIKLAKHSLNSQAALRTLKRLIRISHGIG